MGCGASNSAEPAEELSPNAAKFRTRRSSVSAEVDQAMSTFTFKQFPKEENEERELKAALRDHILFSHLDEDMLHKFAEGFYLEKFEKGKKIIKFGDEAADHFFVLHSGTVDVTVPNKDVALPPSFQMKKGKGYCFGELALMYNSPRAANVEALEDCEVWTIDRQTFIFIIRSKSAPGKSDKLRELETFDILKTLDDGDKSRVQDILSRRKFASGTQIIQQGNATDKKFYLLLQGEAFASKTGDDGANVHLRNLKSGDYFGEMAVIKNSARTADVTANTECVCLVMDIDAFHRLLQGPLSTQFERGFSSYK